MFLLPPAIQKLIKEMKGKKKRVLSLDVKLLAALHKAAEEQKRPEEEILAKWLDSGVKHSSKDWNAELHWKSLTPREQEVLALVCIENRNEEIARILGISIPTVKSHLQGIFDEFGLRSKRELRQLLQDWDFVGWWESRHM